MAYKVPFALTAYPTGNASSWNRLAIEAFFGGGTSLLALGAGTTNGCAHSSTSHSILVPLYLLSRVSFVSVTPLFLGSAYKRLIMQLRA